jgi:hypothetical protein
MLAEARAAYPVQGECRYSLCISHAKRMEVNRRENLAAKGVQDLQENVLKVPVFFEAQSAKGDNAAQSFWCWPGLEMIGAGGKVKKGLFVTVQECSGERLVVTGGGLTTTLSAEAAIRCLRLSYCLTYASCQLAGVRLLETDSPHFSWRHLYVGASRCTSNRLLQVA